MKSTKIFRTLCSLVVIFTMILLSNQVFAQPEPPHPPDNGNQGMGSKYNNNAPVDGGVTFALAMVLGFGAWKMARGRLKKA